MSGPSDQERAVARPTSGRAEAAPRSAPEVRMAAGAPVPLRRPLGIWGNGDGEPDSRPYFLVEAGATVGQVARYLSDDLDLPGILADLNGLPVERPLPGGTQVRVAVDVKLRRPAAVQQILGETHQGLYIDGPASHHGQRTDIPVEELGGAVVPLTESEFAAMCQTQQNAIGRASGICRRLLHPERQRVRESQRAADSYLRHVERSPGRQQLLDQLNDSLRADDRAMAKWASELVDRRIFTSFENVLDSSHFVSDRQRRVFMRYYLQDSAAAQGRTLDVNEVFWMLVELEDAYGRRAQRRLREAGENAAPVPDRRDAELATIKEALRQHMEASQQRASQQRLVDELSRVVAAPDDPEMRSLAHQFVNREFHGTVTNFMLVRRWKSDSQRQKFLQYFVIDYAKTWQQIQLDPDELFLTLYDLETKYQKKLAELDEEAAVARFLNELAEIRRLPDSIRASFDTNDPALRKRARNDVSLGADEQFLWATLAIRSFSSDEERRIYTRYFLMYLAAAGSGWPVQVHAMDDRFDALQRAERPGGHIFRQLLEYERRFEAHVQETGPPSKIPDEQMERILKRVRTEAAELRIRRNFPGVVPVAAYPLLASKAAAATVPTSAFKEFAQYLIDHPWEAVEFLVGFIPVVGEVVAVIEFVTRQEVFTGKEIEGLDQWLLLLGAIPLADGLLGDAAKSMRVVSAVAKAVGKTEARVTGLLRNLRGLAAEERALAQAAAAALYGGRITAAERQALKKASVVLKEGETVAARAAGEEARLETAAERATSEAARGEPTAGRGTTADGVTPAARPAGKGPKKSGEPTATAEAGGKGLPTRPPRTPTVSARLPSRGGRIERGTARQVGKQLYAQLERRGHAPQSGTRAIHPSPDRYPSVEIRPNGDIQGRYAELHRYLGETGLTSKRSATRSSLEAHHIVEDRLMKLYGIPRNEGWSVAMEATEHSDFSKELPRWLPHKRFFDIDNIVFAHERMYQELGYPEFVRQVRTFVRQYRVRIRFLYEQGKVPGAKRADFPQIRRRVLDFLDTL